MPKVENEITRACMRGKIEEIKHLHSAVESKLRYDDTVDVYEVEQIRIRVSGLYAEVQRLAEEKE